MTTSPFTFNLLTSFNGTNGANPLYGSLALDSAGNLYGTTEVGGASNDGTVFEVVAGSGTITTLATFAGTSNGRDPYAGLYLDGSGNLYGTTTYGGQTDQGTEFEIPKGGALTTLQSFTSILGATGPAGTLIADSSGNLYGTAQYGGSSGTGAVYEIAKGGGTTIFASFNNTADSSSTGSDPYAGLVADSAGNFYGTAENSGVNGKGTVYEIVKGSGTITPLAAFNGSNGENPFGALIVDSAGNLFGTTSNGTSNDGTVFEVAAGSGTITTLASFNGTNGSSPYGSLIEDGAGDLYGTTYSGGAQNDGTVFEIVKGSGTVTTLYSFSGTDGAHPLGGLVADRAGNLYGTTQYGGASGDGAVFELAYKAVAPTIAGTVGGQTTTDGATIRPFANVTIGDANASSPVNATDALTITFDRLSGSGAGGTLSGTGLTFVSDGVYTLSGDPGTITSELQALSFAPTVGQPNTSSTSYFKLSDQSSAYALPTADSTTSVVDTDPAVAPTISGTVAGQTTTSNAAIAPFSGVTIGDTNAGGTDTLTITLSGAGTLSGTGLSGGNGSYTLTGTAAAITSQLQALTFKSADQPNSSSTTTFTLSDQSSVFPTPTTDATTSVTDTDPPVAPTLTGTISLLTTGSGIIPFDDVSISDPNVGAMDTLTITVSTGTLSGNGLTDDGNGVYTLTGTAGNIEPDLNRLTYTPPTGGAASVTFTLSDLSDAFATPATLSNTIVTNLGNAKDGANGMEAGQAGANGSAGNNVVVYDTPTQRGTTNAANPTNTAAAGVDAFSNPSSTPGTWGGNGGNGYGYGNSAITGTAAGSGGAGGTATTKTVTTADYASASPASARAGAYGGNGGNGGTPGFSTPAKGTTAGTLAKGGSGGVGGAASAISQATNSGNASVVASAQANGGSGGTGYNAAGGAGAGATASATAVSDAAGYNASASAVVFGGAGGKGTKGVGGAGASVALTNAVGGATNGGKLTLEQDAIAQNGGSSQGATAGAAGSATSTLTFNDTAGKNPNGMASGSTPALVSKQILGGSDVLGGNGGGAYGSTLTAAAGGAGTSTVTLTGVGLGFYSIAQGGAGGFGFQGGISGGNSGGAGGKGTASLNGSAITPSATSYGSDLLVRAGGGTGGTGAYTTAKTGLAAAVAGGSGGAGGAAAASLTGTIASVTGGKSFYGSGDDVGPVGYDNLFATRARGGAGGTAEGIGKSGGAGGVATTTTSVTGKSSVASTVVISVDGTGGNGGIGKIGASGGAGAATTLSTTIGSALTTGGTVNLEQITMGGNGGKSYGGTASGAGGAAGSTISLTDASSKTIVGSSEAYGGRGGNGYGVKFTSTTATPTTTYKYAPGGAGGNATATATAVGAIGVAHTNSYAYHYQGPYAPPPSSLPGLQAVATGGVGGNAQGSGVNGGVGGAGTATATGTSTLDGSTILANAHGGQGGGSSANGNETPSGNGGAGGAATATAKGTTSATGALPQDLAAGPTYGQPFADSDLSVTGRAQGASGGTGFGTGHSGGVGGAATATATGISSLAQPKAATNGSVVQVKGQASGGYGGGGENGANGGNGGNATVNNPAGSTAKGGILYIGEGAYGGNGGGEDGGASTTLAGNGGTATTTLNLSDTSQILAANIRSQGGRGGNARGTGGGKGGVGGNATASLTLSSTTAKGSSTQAGVSGISEASGGYAGTDAAGSYSAAGGTGTATIKVTGPGVVSAFANASGGIGGAAPASGGSLSPGQHNFAATSTATATATGTSSVGEFSNEAGVVASTFSVLNNFITSTERNVVFIIGATADADVHGNTTTGATATATAFSQTSFNAAAPNVTTAYQSMAQVVGDPTTAAAAAIAKADPNIAAAFANKAAATYFAAGEMGGSFDTNGVAGTAETVAQAISFELDPSQLTPNQQGDLVIALYGSTSAANSSLTSLDFTVSLGVNETATAPISSTYNTANTNGHFHFTSAADAKAFFNDDILNFGSITALEDPSESNLVFLNITMTETFKTVGSNFVGQFLIGDPTPASASASNTQVGELASALFNGFFGSSGTDAGATSHTPPSAPPPVMASTDLTGAHHGLQA